MRTAGSLVVQVQLRDLEGTAGEPYLVDGTHANFNLDMRRRVL